MLTVAEPNLSEPDCFGNAVAPRDLLRARGIRAEIWGPQILVRPGPEETSESEDERERVINGVQLVGVQPTG